MPEKEVRELLRYLTEFADRLPDEVTRGDILLPGVIIQAKGELGLWLGPKERALWERFQRIGRT